MAAEWRHSRSVIETWRADADLVREVLAAKAWKMAKEGQFERDGDSGLRTTGPVKCSDEDLLEKCHEKFPDADLTGASVAIEDAQVTIRTRRDG